MNFSFIDDGVAGSACPFSKREVDWFRKKGIKAVLSLTESRIRADWLGGLDYKNIPVKDHSIPTLSQLEESVDFIISQNKLGHVVVVHCMAGKGRTGTVLAAYLCKKHGVTSEEALSKLRSKRPGSVERRQTSVVEEFSKSVARRTETEK